MEAPTTELQYVDYTEAERITFLDRVTLWRAVRDGDLKASGRGRGIRFKVRDLEAFMDARGQEGQG
jgi:hypothetical protein